MENDLFDLRSEWYFGYSNFLMIFIPKALPDYKWLGELKEKLTLLQETSDPVGDRCSVGEPLYRTDGKSNFMQWNKIYTLKHQLS